MRVVDALEKIALPAFNLDAIAFSGHSRGGKTAALAGVLDTRAAFVNPNATCAGACGCYRVHVTASSKDTPSFKSETLADILRNFPQWFGPDIHRYADRENELPFNSSLCQPLKEVDSIEIPFWSAEQSERTNLQLDVFEDRNTYTRYLLYIQLHILQTYQRSIELTPQRIHTLIASDLTLQFLFKFIGLLLAFLHLKTQSRLLAFNDRQGTLTHLQILLDLL